MSTVLSRPRVGSAVGVRPVVPGSTWVGLLCLVVVVSLCGSGFVTGRYARPVPLHADTVALGAGGRVVEVPGEAGDLLVPGTRVLAGVPDSARLAAGQRAWLAAGTVPVVPELGGSTLVRDALLDLAVLSRTDGVPVAGWSGPWRYVWPRDSALVAAAFARTGHVADAERVLTFLDRVQPASGVFQARYLPDASGVPDDRGVQLDGTGWALWASAQVAAAVPPADRAAFWRRHRGLVDRSSDAILRLLQTPSGLPPVSADYWEVAERRLTLATAALLRAGLEASCTLYTDRDPARAARTCAAAVRLGDTITARFGPDGYPRHLGGPRDSVDLGVGFLLPPFAARTDPGARAAWAGAP
ncbi:MAG: glycoside hydrolase 15-related protein, partial [Friedmanniella sp.]|nr:glycoside hydrolase 15-related protein [Friedmanniella sp.]